jgi:hypothetical protein
MRPIESKVVANFFLRFLPGGMIAAILILIVQGCQKTGMTSSSSGGGTALLSKEVIVGFNAQNTQLDSIVMDFQYNGSHNLSQLQQATVSSDSGAVFNQSLTYNFTYAASLISGVTGSYTESIQYGSQTLNAATQINTSFTASGGKIVSYVQTTTTTGSPIIPITTETGNDSATLAYDANGNLSTYIIYQKQYQDPNYSLLSKQTFTFSGGNLSQSVNVLYVEGFSVDTVTTVYEYNSKLSAAPIFIFPGVNISSINDLTQVTLTTNGVNPSVVTSTYQTTYNANNQPVSSTVTVATTPANQGTLTKEDFSYFY